MSAGNSLTSPPTDTFGKLFLIMRGFGHLIMSHYVAKSREA